MSKIETHVSQSGTKYKILKARDFAYGDEISFSISNSDLCDICDNQTCVMIIDTSNGEYASFRICKDCFTKEIDSEFKEGK